MITEIWARLLVFLVHYFLVTIKARLLVKNKNHFQQKNVYLRDPPPGNGRPHYVFQLSDIGFIGKIFSLMVTSSHIWLISPILNVPNLKVIFLVKNSTILSKQTKSFTLYCYHFANLEGHGARALFSPVSLPANWLFYLNKQKVLPIYCYHFANLEGHGARALFSPVSLPANWPRLSPT